MLEKPSRTIAKPVEQSSGDCTSSTEGYKKSCRVCNIVGGCVRSLPSNDPVWRPLDSLLGQAVSCRRRFIPACPGAGLLPTNIPTVTDLRPVDRKAVLRSVDTMSVRGHRGIQLTRQRGIPRSRLSGVKISWRGGEGRALVSVFATSH